MILYSCPLLLPNNVSVHLDVCCVTACSSFVPPRIFSLYLHLTPYSRRSRRTPPPLPPSPLLLQRLGLTKDVLDFASPASMVGGVLLKWQLSGFRFYYGVVPIPCLALNLMCARLCICSFLFDPPNCFTRSPYWSLAVIATNTADLSDPSDSQFIYYLSACLIILIHLRHNLFTSLSLFVSPYCFSGLDFLSLLVKPSFPGSVSIFASRCSPFFLSLIPVIVSPSFPFF